MTDKHKNRGDEYQFPQDEYVAAEDESQQPNHDAFKGESTTDNAASVEAPQSKGSLLERFPILQNKRVLMTVGFAVVAIIAFQIMTPSHKTTVIKQMKPKVNLQQQQQNALLNKVDRISKDATNAQDAQNQLQAQLNALKASVNRSNESNKAMREAVVDLAQQVQNLSVRLKKATTKPNHIKKLPPSPVLTFHLRAIVPGRAWIKGSNGESDSVKVGSKIKNYGTVKAIDSTAGKILTSSGKVISYDSEGN